MDAWPQPAAPPPATEPGADARSLARAMEDLAARLEEVEHAVEGRLEELAGVVETKVVEHVVAELSNVTAELRRVIAELGRMLVRDRGRIAQVLAEHRDAILAEIRTPAQASEPPAERG